MKTSSMTLDLNVGGALVVSCADTGGCIQEMVILAHASKGHSVSDTC